ncbi:MAG: Gfo/Idh/MocA family oxidoreductase [Eubacteriales bacterium]|nr:Gfo/Idh/MocA family oxidoreductase [Eubacteriales bacterium]
MEKAKLAVIGLNFGRNHAAYIAAGNVRGTLEAVADLNPDFQAMAGQWGTRFYTDYREMLGEVKPDGVLIAVPPKFHKDIAIDCMRAGAHVLVEKPITLTSEEADELIAEGKQTGKTILVGQHHRFDPSVQMAKKRLDSGELGQLIGFHIYGTLPKPPWYYGQDYKKRRSLGGGTVANNGIHDVDRIRYLFGDIESVFAMKGNAYRHFEVEDTAAVAIKCRNGVVGTYYISDCSHPISEYTDCYFAEKGSIRLKCSSFYAQAGFHTYQECSLSEGFDYRERERTLQTVQIPVQNNHGKEVEHFCAVILDGEEPRTSGEDGKKSMEAMNAIVESLDTGKPVYLNED